MIKASLQFTTCVIKVGRTMKKRLETLATWNTRLKLRALAFTGKPPESEGLSVNLMTLSATEIVCSQMQKKRSWKFVSNYTTETLVEGG